MAKICTQIDEWIEEEVSRPVEEWEERQEKRCKEYPWYDPRGWFCWIVTFFVKVVRWVVDKVGRWVTRTVCKALDAVVKVGKALVKGVVDVVAGVFTGDWRRILDGLLGIVLGVVLGWIRIWRILLLGDTIDFIVGEINRRRLRDHVRGLLEAKYSGAQLDDIKQAIRLEHGAFGLRLNATCVRTFLDSETPSPTEAGVPNIVKLHEAGRIDLRELCGFAFNEGYWNRKRYKTLKKEDVVAGGGGGELDNPISEDELDEYLGSRGQRGPKFRVFAMRDGVRDDKLDAAEDKARELGVILSWATRDVEVTKAEHIVHTSAPPDRFLIDVAGRTDKAVDDRKATQELCHPVVVGVFRFDNTLRGISACLRGSRCDQRAAATSGATFIDNQPDEIWQYVPIHELGHTFGLCHVDGIERIMVSSRESSLISWWTIPDVYLKGEPSFTLDEAMAAWDYIVANFDARCLGATTATIAIADQPAEVAGRPPIVA